MALKLIKEGGEVLPESPSEKNLFEFCQSQNLDCVLEWLDGQYWLHSDRESERPFTIHIDDELKRHEEFFKRSSLQKELLAKAIGVKPGHRPKVVDLTAGLLGDSLLMLAMGCEVTAIERHPLVVVLIESALQKAQHPALERFTFFPSSATDFLDRTEACDVLYFDPMFEDANDKASPRKEMRVFREFVGADQDAKDVFEKALKKKVRRLVVKRPRLSLEIGTVTPLRYEGKSTRYDVYLG